MNTLQPTINKEKNQMNERKGKTMKKTKKKFDFVKFTKKCALAAIGLLLLGMAYRWFLLENDYNLGGYGGVGQILAKFGINITVTVVVLNISSFCVAAFKKKWGFLMGSIVATVLYGVVMDWFPKVELPIHFLVGLPISSILAGIGFGLIVKAGASTGGTDFLAAYIHDNYTKKLSIGAWMNIFDGIIILSFCLITRQNFWQFTLSLFAMSLCNEAVDLVLMWGKLREHYEKHFTVKAYNHVSNAIAKVRVKRVNTTVAISPVILSKLTKESVEKQQMSLGATTAAPEHP